MLMHSLRRRAYTTLANRHGTLYSYGEGFLGSLGTGSYENVDSPTALALPHDIEIKEISAGWAHAGFVTRDGQAYLYGRTHSFRDVIRVTNMQRIVPWLVKAINALTIYRGADQLTPALIPLPDGERVKKMVCSTGLTFILTESGKVYTLGANIYGQCGTGVESVSVAEPTQINLGDEVVDIAAGFQHGLAVTASGSVFAWGKGERGQLGFGTANVNTPHEVIALKPYKIKTVGAGFNHSTAVTSDGELFVWGKLLNIKGKEDQVTPRLLKTRDPVRLEQCSHFHSTFITSDNKIWMIGRTPSGRQLQGDRLVQVPSEMHTTPFEIKDHNDLDVGSVCKLGKGIDSTTFVTAAGEAFEWTFTKGIQRIAEVQHLQVHTLESGFKYRLLFA